MGENHKVVVLYVGGMMDQKKSYEQILAEMNLYLADKFDAEVDSRLVDTTVLEDFTPELRARVASLALNKDPIVRRLSSIINACYTQNTTTFGINRRELDLLVSKDVNYKPNYVDSDSYSMVKNQMISSGMFKEVRPPVIGKEKGERKSGIYELVDELYLQPLYVKLAKPFFEAKKEKIVKWYDEQLTKDQLNQEQQDLSPEELTKQREEYMLMKKKAGIE